MQTTQGTSDQGSESSSLNHDGNYEDNDDDPTFDLKKSCTLLLLNSKEVYKMSQSAIDEVLIDVTLLMQQHALSIKSEYSEIR